MKKEIIKPAMIFAVLEIFLFLVFILQNSAFALLCAIFFLFLSAASFGITFAVKNKISAN